MADQDLIDTTPLDEEELAEAKERIAALHPLKNLPVGRVIPFLGICFRSKKDTGVSPEDKQIDFGPLRRAGRDLGVSINEPLLSEKDIEPLEDPNQDPYLSLGFGMVAYFSMLKALVLCFMLFSLLAFPMISTYSSYKGLETGNNYSKTKFSLGNFGFSEHLCKHIFAGIDEGNYEFACRSGNISKLSWSGILPSTDDQKVFGSYMGYCANPDNIPEVKECEDAFDYTFVNQYFKDHCVGHNKC